MNEQEKGRGERRRQARREGSLKKNSKNKKGTKVQTRRTENKKQQERKEEERGSHCQVVVLARHLKPGSESLERMMSFGDPKTRLQRTI